MPYKNDLRDQLQRAISILAKHPLANSVPKELIKHWLIETAKVDPDRLVWHAKRTMGIGGSEIFKAVAFLRSVKASAKGEYYDVYTMSSVQDVAKGKIFLSSPQAPDSNMLRGILNEPLARQMYVAKLERAGRKVVRDTESRKALQSFHNPNHPWHKYNDDDILIIDGKRTLIDYKCPSPDQLGFHSYVDEDYVHQLHLGYSALSEMGIQVDAMALVKYNVIDCEVTELSVPISLELCKENIEAGDYLYNNYILKNRTPEYQPSLGSSLTLAELKHSIEQQMPIPGTSDTVVQSLHVLSHKLATAKSIATAAAKHADGLSSDICKLVSSLPLHVAEDAPTTIAIGGVEIKYDQSEKLDESALVALAAAKGINVNEYAISKIDVKGLASAVSEVSTEAEILKFKSISHQFSAGCTRKQKGATADAYLAVKQVSEELVAQSISSLDSPQAYETMLKLDDEISKEINTRRFRDNHFRQRWTEAIETLTNNSIDLQDEMGAASKGEQQLAR